MGNGSVEVIKKIGGFSVGVSAVLPGCFGFPLSERVLAAAHAFGSYLNLIDVLRDAEEDRLQDIATPLTGSTNLDADKAFVADAARECWQMCEDAVGAKERRKLRSLRAMTDIVMRFEGKKYSWRAYRSIEAARLSRLDTLAATRV
jgi:hypothetical protein